VSETTVPVGKFDAIPLADFANLNCESDDHGLLTSVAKMRCMFKAYINADQKHINQPVAILKINSAGTRWIDPGACSGNTVKSRVSR
jgi:hypothetical protein